MKSKIILFFSDTKYFRYFVRLKNQKVRFLLRDNFDTFNLKYIEFSLFKKNNKKKNTKGVLLVQTAGSSRAT